MMPSELPQHEHLRLTDLRRLLFEETTAEEAARMRAVLAECEVCQARYSALERQQQAFLQTARPEVVSAQILERLDAEPERPAALAWWRRPWLPAMAAAAALFAVAPSMMGPDTTPTTREKGGGVGLVMFVKDAHGIRRADDGERLREGDQVQFRYAASGLGHLFVVSVDSRGVVAPLYPEDPTQSIDVEAEGTHVLEGSVILDDAVGPERFFALFSETPVRFAEIDEAVRAARAEVADVTGLSALPLGRDDVLQASVRIVKE